MEEYVHCIDEESFQILICEVVATINSRPLMTVSGERNKQEPLTSNDILRTKSPVIIPPPGKFHNSDVYVLQRWQKVQYLANLFWSWWKK